MTRSSDVSYGEMREYFTEEKVRSFTATDRRLTAKLADDTAVSCPLQSFNTFYNDLNDLVVSQSEKGIITDYNYAAEGRTNWLSALLPYVLAAMAFILLMNLIARTGGMNSGVNDKMARFGEARIQDIPDQGKKITFKDVAGADEEKEELEEIVQFLRDPQRYTELGAHIPKGVLLVGPPGTGKTLLAKAVAGEADTAFLSISGSDFVEMYVGVGASRVRDLFEQAKQNSPAIIFIDEIDAVGRQRGSGLGGGHDEREQTLNQLLVEMDGFAANEGVVVLAATNRVDILDPALLRPGRFDRQVFVGLPDIKGREEILKTHARGKPLAEDVDLARVARATSGFTGADLENLLNEAALLTGRLGQRLITEESIHQSVIKVIAGPEKHSRVVPEAERRLTAYHEAGHAVVIHSLPDLDPVHQITIVPRGQAGCMTIYLPEEDRSYLSRTYMLEQVAGLLGGRAAEGNAVHAEAGQPLEQDHHQHGGDAAQHGEQHGGQVSGEQPAQQAARHKDRQCCPCAQTVQGKDGDDVGKPQLHAGERDQQRHGEQPLQRAQAQCQCRQHGAQGDIFRCPTHSRHPTITSGASGVAAPTSEMTTCAGRQTMDCPARVITPVWTQSWVGQSLSVTATPPSLVLTRRV